MKRFPVGMHRLSLQNLTHGGGWTRGFYIIDVKGKGFEKQFTTIHMGK
jgi:hypothetical protein